MNQDELQLVAGMQAFGKLYDAIEPKLQEAAIRMLRDACEVDEFMQDCRAMLLVEACKTFKPDLQSFCWWSERIVVNACRKRREQLDREISLEEIADLPDPRDLISDAETRVDYEMAVKKLPPMQKRCWEMRQEGYTYGQLARSIGISENAVKQNLHKARVNLQGAMEVT